MFAEEFRGPEPKENCSLLEWGACQEQRSYLRRARVRLKMAGWERGEEWEQCRRVWGSLPTIWMGRQEGQWRWSQGVYVWLLARWRWDGM